MAKMLGFRDLRTSARVFVTAVALGGSAVLALSVLNITQDPPDERWLLLACLTLLSGSIAIKIPSVSATLSVSEAFVYTSVLLFGPPAGTLTAALDALVISLWLQRKGQPVYRVIFNGTAVALSLWISAQAFFYFADIEPLARTDAPIQQVLLPLAVLAILDFFLNTILVAVAIALEQRRSAADVWRGNFMWLSLNYFSGASMAALLVAYTRELDVTVLWIIVPLLVISYLTHKTSMGRVEDAHKHLLKLNSLYMSTIEALAMAIDAKDQITHGHIRRVQVYAVGLAKELGLSEERDIRAIEAAALLHDMGKLAVPEYILNKPGKLTAAEFDKMKLHASVGADILSSIDFPYPVVPLVRHHHESWDGTGYPDGLRGTDIPIGARILAVVDCFDALTSDRPYRPRLPDEDALAILRQRRGAMYDPIVVDTFINVHSTISQGLSRSPLEDHVLTAISEASHSPVLTATPSGSLEQISSSAEEMLALYELARSARSDIGLQDLADLIMKHLRRLVPTCLCAIYVHDRTSDELVGAYASGDYSGSIVKARIAMGQRITGWIAANRRSILNSDPVLDLGDAARTAKPRLRSCLGAALVDGEYLVGVITLYSPLPDAFTEEHRRILEAVAGQTTSAIRLALEFDCARHAEMRDTVTGLPNSEQLQRLFSPRDSARGTAPSLAILLVDIHDLKRINQRFGREGGDRVLASVAGAIRVALRGEDILFRLRSDEFVAVVAQADDRTLKTVAERVEASIAAGHHPPVPQEETVRVSVVWAVTPVDGNSLDELLSASRKRLRTNQPHRKSSDSEFPSVH